MNKSTSRHNNAHLVILQQATKHTVIQWKPSHCNIAGNEEAVMLARKGGQQPQEEQDTSYEEAKTLIKKKQERTWLLQHPEHSKNDPYYLLSRTEWVCIVRLRTGHCRLRHHMHTKFCIGESSVFPCGTASMTMEHLQNCPTHQNLKTKIWSADQPRLYRTSLPTIEGEAL